MFWVIFGLGFRVGVWLNFNFLFVFVCVGHPQFSHLSLSPCLVFSLSFCLPAFFGYFLILPWKAPFSFMCLPFLAVPAITDSLVVFSCVLVPVSLITSISWILGFLYFLDVSAKKYCYMKLKSFLFIFYFIFMIVLNCLYIILCIS